MSEPEAPALTPWFQMWVRPQATIQQVVDAQPRRWVLVLAGLLGISSSISIVLPGLCASLGWPLGLGLGVPFVVLVGIYAFLITAALLTWTGRWIGGLAPGVNVRAALAWSGIPLVWGLLVWIPRSVWFDYRLFHDPAELFAEVPFAEELFSGFLLFDLTLNVWAALLLVKAVAQVQGFSTWKALANLILTVMVLATPLILLIVAGVIWQLFA